MIEACLFDLDGTLLDSEVLWVEAVHLAMVSRGAAMSADEARELVYGRGWPDIHRELGLRYPRFVGSRQAMEAAIGREYRALQSRRDIRLPSSIALLVRLARDYPVAIVSGSTRETIAEGIRLMDIDAHVTLYVGAEDTALGKPHPECFLLAARKLHVAPAGCLVFEDSQAGVMAAKAAGMRCVGLRRPDRPVQDLSLADEILADLADFDLGRYA